MIQELISIEAKSTNIDFLYFDFMVDENDNDNYTEQFAQTVGPNSYVKAFELLKAPALSNLEKETADFLRKNIKDNGKYKYIGGIIKYDHDTDEDFDISLSRKLNMYNFHLADNGRIGGADTYVLNSKMHKEIFTTLSKLKNIKIVINEFIEDDVMYLIHNGSKETPGYKFVHYTDPDGQLYYSFIETGFFPELQAAKLVIYRSKKSSIISNIPGANRTGIPLSECGCIIEHHVGVAGLSPRQAEEQIAIMIANHSDDHEPNEENKLKNHFKFYKEYWLANPESDKHEIKINLI